MPGRVSNPQSLNGYIYVVDRPTSLEDPTGQDPCNLLNPFTYVGCVKNRVQAVNNYVVQPTESYVNKNVVQPVVSFVTSALPIIKNVVMPTIENKATSLLRMQETLDRTLYDTLNNAYGQVHAFLVWNAETAPINHLRVTNWTNFLTGLAFCGAVAGLAAGVVFAGPEVATGEAAVELATTGTITGLSFATGLWHVIGGVILFGTGCIGLTASSLTWQ